MKKIYIYLHCDLQKTYTSMETPDEYYPDTQEGRAKLIEAIDNDVAGGYVEPTKDMALIRQEIRHGQPETVSDFLDYAYIRVLGQAY